MRSVISCEKISVKAACDAIRLPRATFYRYKRSNGTFIGPEKARILPYTPIEIKPGVIIHLACKQKLDLSQLYYLGYEEFKK
jgi:hypothetical protein